MIIWLPVILGGIVSLAPMSMPPVPPAAPVRAGSPPAPRDVATAPAARRDTAAGPRDPSIPAVRSGSIPSIPVVVAPADTEDGSIPYAALLNDPMRRVRTTDPRVRSLILEGMRRSVTFGELVTAMNASDVIVYIQRVSRLAPAIAGQLMIVPVPNAQRYLRIQVLDHLSPSETIALIGHELRHALEVAAQPDVRDQEGLTRLYQRIGERSTGIHSFDTREAQNTGKRVKAELEG